MINALVGFTGFVGSTLMKQAEFSALYRSTNIHQIAGKEFDFMVCAGAPAQKWIANQTPENDLKKIDLLIDHLSSVKCKTIVLISTVDVFKRPVGVREDTLVDEEGLHAYGVHRRKLEKFVESHFESRLIVRLPGLVGPGLRKNVIFDLHNSNNLGAIESRSIFQFYPMVNLWADITTALQAELELVHLTAAPISVEDASTQGFGKPFKRTLEGAPVMYDMQTSHADVFGSSGAYQYSCRETIQAIRAYAQSEPFASNVQPIQ